MNALKRGLILLSLLPILLVNCFYVPPPFSGQIPKLSNSESHVLRRKEPFSDTWLAVSSGFSFEDGEQVLVSVQKPLGIVLEQEEDGGIIVVAEIDPSGSAARAGVKVGDVLLAVQNASVQDRSLEYVMDFLGQAPRVVNLRFSRV